MGSCGPEWITQSLQDIPVVNSGEEAEEEFQKELSQWRKDPSKSKKKPIYSYKTMEKLKANSRVRKKLTDLQKEFSQVKVIDMTVREQKVYYSYSQISHKHNIPDKGLPQQSQQLPLPCKEAKALGSVLPELEHNLQLLTNLTEQQIMPRVGTLVCQVQIQ
ncbi:hypothetical protein HJG60_010477 [Phyllostomus discolor]|uniref:Uncharacterized protein n=1 Tax=Phyllostomus discolor TaxID=89673 RepID=A0A834AGX0_9CHIR|nr:hypothetical protein HJG60_010477 [Phyllostomus discolor]